MLDLTSTSTTDDFRYRMLVENITDYAIYLLDPTGIVSSWNPGARRFKGYEAAEIIGQNFSNFYTPEDQAAGLPQRALAIAAEKGTFQGEGWRQRKDGTRFWASVVIDPVRDHKGKILGYAKITRDLTERRAAQMLQASEAQFRSFAQSMVNQVWAADAQGNLNWFSQRTLDYIGLPETELAGEGWTQAVHPDDLPRAGAQWAAALASGKIYETEFRIRRADGIYRWHLARAAPLQGDAGNITGWIGTNTDIEANKQLEEQRVLLLGELNHRVKNLFALVSGIVAISARSATTADELANALRGRLEALNQAHELIQPGLRPQGEAMPGLADLAELIDRIFSPYILPGTASRIKIAGPKIAMPEQAATGMALVFHELATNAAKYGALRDADGSISIDWQIQENTLTLHWIETAQGASATSPERLGFGSKLIRRTMEGQFGGGIAYDWNAKGVAITLTAKLSSLQGAY